MWRFLWIFFVGIATAQQPSDLEQRLARIAEEARGRVGFSALVLETGESAALHGTDKFPMQSVYKFPIAMAVLAKVDRGELSLEEKVRVLKSDLPPKDIHSPLRDKHPEGEVDFTVSELIQAAVSVSDGTASDVLMRLAGGAAAITNFLIQLGVKEINVATTEAEMAADNSVQYRNSATPEAMVRLLRLLHEGRGLSAGSREFLLKVLVETSTGPQRIKGLLPAEAVVAHKTGTSKATCNDVGLLALPNGKHLALAIFVSDAESDLKMRESVIARIARATWDHWSTR